MDPEICKILERNSRCISNQAKCIAQLKKDNKCLKKQIKKINDALAPEDCITQEKIDSILENNIIGDNVCANFWCANYFSSTSSAPRSRSAITSRQPVASEMGEQILCKAQWHSGTGTFVVPANVNRLEIEVAGGGGGGGAGGPSRTPLGVIGQNFPYFQMNVNVSGAGGEGGGGGEIRRQTIAVRPGNRFDIKIGNGGKGATPLDPSSTLPSGPFGAEFGQQTSIIEQGITGPVYAMISRGGIGGRNGVYFNGNNFKNPCVIRAESGGGGGAGLTDCPFEDPVDTSPLSFKDASPRYLLSASTGTINNPGRGNAILNDISVTGATQLYISTIGNNIGDVSNAFCISDITNVVSTILGDPDFKNQLEIVYNELPFDPFAYHITGGVGVPGDTTGMNPQPAYFILDIEPVGPEPVLTGSPDFAIGLVTTFFLNFKIPLPGAVGVTDDGSGGKNGGFGSENTGSYISANGGDGSSGGLGGISVNTPKTENIIPGGSGGGGGGIGGGIGGSGFTAFGIGNDGFDAIIAIDDKGLVIGTAGGGGGGAGGGAQIGNLPDRGGKGGDGAPGYVTITCLH